MDLINLSVRCIVIISGQFARAHLEKLLGLSNVRAIVIFCWDTASYMHLRTGKVELVSNKIGDVITFCKPSLE
jgi:hypothetical protein